MAAYLLKVKLNDIDCFPFLPHVNLYAFIMVTGIIFQNLVEILEPAELFHPLTIMPCNSV